jgi:sulfur relay (sulfurtransferase) complex TusBCD TusD component (DsrE family)
MEKSFALVTILVSIGLNVFSQSFSKSVNISEPKSTLKPTLGIVLYSNDAETVWNAFRLANFAESKGDTVAIFLLGKGVEALTIESKEFDINQKADDFLTKGGQILACGTCLKMRKTEAVKACTVSNLGDLYEIIKTSKKVLTF